MIFTSLNYAKEKKWNNYISVNEIILRKEKKLNSEKKKKSKRNNITQLVHMTRIKYSQFSLSLCFFMFHT